MYDILRLINRIYRKHPPKFWYTVLFFIALIVISRPLVTTVIGIIDPPEPTATPRPTPDISQEGRIGEPLLVLDTYYTLTGWQEYDSACVPLDKSARTEAGKTVVVEFFARHYGEEPAELSNFFLRDANGTNYRLTASTSVEDYRRKCAERLSEGISRPAAELTITKGYGVHFYFYSRNIPRSAAGLEFTFQVSYSIPYPVTGTPVAGASKIFIPLGKPGTAAEPPKVMLGAPDSSSLSVTRTASSGNTAFAVNDVNRIAGDNDRTLYYMEMLYKNISGRMLDMDISSAFSFAVVDDYGVAMPAELAMNSGYNASLAPGETQKYYLRWSMEQGSVRLRNFYLRIRPNGQDREFFIQIPFKESMLDGPSVTPTAAEYLFRTPVPNIQTTEPVPTAAVPEKCINTLPPRLKPGDTAAVTYTPPVANRLRRQPGYTGTVTGLMNPGSIFYVMDGPVCADGLYWYYVSCNGILGWTAESDEGKYWLEKNSLFQ